MSNKSSVLEFTNKRYDKIRRQTMRSKLTTLVLLTVLSVLALNACTPTTGAGDEVPTLAPTAAPVDVADDEICVDKNTGASLSYQEAVEIAQRSECLAEGQLKETRFCNEDTGTWWIDLEMEMPNCNPACVVDLNAGTAEINGRCMGAVPPPTEAEDTPPSPVQMPDETIEIPGWMTYRNESHGYSFQYPPDCFYGPMAGYCKQSPPEERPLECLCFLNGEDPDWVFLQAFIGEKDNLTLASFDVSHRSSPQYDPPPGTDVAQWLNENWSDRYQEIPGEPNAEISGIPAVRIYSPESPGVYSSEVIFIIHDGKLFQIQMVDVDNEDNRELYDQMLSTFEIAGGTPGGELPAVAWYGYVISAAAGSQFDDYLVVLPEGTAKVSLSGADAAIEAEIVALRDVEAPGKHAHFWGTLACPMLDYGGCEFVVSRLRTDGPGTFFDPDPVEAWEGTIFGGPPGPRSGGDDSFVLLGDWNIWYGIWSADADINSQLESLRDTETVIRVWGEIIAGIPDWNGTQIQVSRFEVVEDPSAALPPAPDWPEADDGMIEYLNEDYGYQLRVPPTALITESGPEGFLAADIPEGMSADDYLAQLQEQYGNQLCVRIEYALGYMNISAPPNEGFRYAICGLTGLGVGDVVQKSEEVNIAGQTYTFQGFEWIGNTAPCSPPRETLDCHFENMSVVLHDGTQIQFGTRHEPTARFEDYLMKGRDMLLRVIASYETMPARLSGYSYEGWETYTSEKYGYSVKYPGGAAVMGGNLDNAVQFAGSAAGGEDWPVLTVDHPDTDFYHPPAGTNVHDWVIDFGYYHDEIGPVGEIAGVPAVHLRTAASSMAWGYDEFFFIKGDQLFRVLILHTDGHEGWALYSQFLESFSFE